MTPGVVTFLDHTADIGCDVTAPSPEALLDAAARAMLALLRGDEEGDGGWPAPSSGVGPLRSGTERELTLSAPEPARLLADWLRELLFLHEVERLDYDGASFQALRLTGSPSGPGVAGAPCLLTAAVRFAPGGHAVREIKGVTYHAIHVRRGTAGWSARVIFDV